MAAKALSYVSNRQRDVTSKSGHCGGNLQYSPQGPPPCAFAPKVCKRPASPLKYVERGWLSKKASTTFKHDSLSVHGMEDVMSPTPSAIRPHLQLLTPDSASLAWKSSKSESDVKSEYHSGCCMKPVCIAQFTASLHSGAGELHLSFLSMTTAIGSHVHPSWPFSANLAWNSLKLDVRVRPEYHEGCCTMPVCMAQSTAFLHAAVGGLQATSCAGTLGVASLASFKSSTDPSPECPSSSTTSFAKHTAATHTAMSKDAPKQRKASF
mmetsp:Transcript_40757/g.112122  ORF Transcript_40757/g.112122 Transcript_40757/m.112122 type:complete len:266 (+) Transcript_40757:268-1065(+)